LNWCRIEVPLQPKMTTVSTFQGVGYMSSQTIFLWKVVWFAVIWLYQKNL